MLVRTVKEHESIPLPSKGFFSALTTAVEYSKFTASGASIDTPIPESQAEQSLGILIDYLNKNLEILCMSLSPSMAQEVIKRLWDESLLIIESLLAPTLYGEIERDRRLLNRRQTSMVKWSLGMLRDFFHADGEGLGIPYNILDTRKFAEVTAMIERSRDSLQKLCREYELTLLAGRDKEYLLRVIRARVERDDTLSPEERQDGQKWFQAQLAKR